MSATVLYMSMSLDGFIAGPNESPENGLGDGGERLHDWLWSGSEPGGPSSSARAADCSRASLPSRSSCSAPASSRARTVSRTCITASRLS